MRWERRKRFVKPAACSRDRAPSGRPGARLRREGSEVGALLDRVVAVRAVVIRRLALVLRVRHGRAVAGLRSARARSAGRKGRRCPEHRGYERYGEYPERRIPSFDAEVVVYCANPKCESSVEVAQRLVEMGYRNVRHYPGGKDDWREAGLPLEGGRV